MHKGQEQMFVSIDRRLNDNSYSKVTNKLDMFIGWVRTYITRSDIRWRCLNLKRDPILDEDSLIMKVHEHK